MGQLLSVSVFFKRAEIVPPTWGTVAFLHSNSGFSSISPF